MINDNIYDLVNYLKVVNGIPDLQFSPVYEEIKKLTATDYFSTSPATEFLDQIAYSYYGIYELWWVIAIYNDIVYPMNNLPTELKIPLKLDVENLLRTLRS